MNQSRYLFHMLNNMYANFCSSSEHIAVDKDIVLFKWRDIFKQYIPKKHFGIKTYKPCDMA
jgi:hypothetical protein